MTTDTKMLSPKTTAEDVVELLKLFKSNGVTVWVDGGWAIDAVVGRQTREHEDLDIALYHVDVPLVRQLLEERNFFNVARDDTRECNFVLGDIRGRQVDIHSFTFDSNGNCIFGVPYPIQSLSGKGAIANYELDCIAPEWLLKFRSGYALRPKDFEDVTVLCERFGFEIPPEFRRA